MKRAIEPPNFISSRIKAFFTKKIFADGNKHFNEIIAREFDIPIDNIYLPIQKHTNKIHVLKSKADLEPVVADAVVTAERNMLIGVLVADCVPVLLYDRKKEVAGAVHAGWRGTSANILKNTIEVMKDRFNSSVEDLSIAIGPSIRKCCYEVGKDVHAAIQNSAGKGEYSRKLGEKYFVDLSLANKIQALNVGVPQDNIWQSDECTFCNPGKFFSYRFSQDYRGRQGGFIGMW
jgi:YfiH family protein